MPEEDETPRNRVEKKKKKKKANFKKLHSIRTVDGYGLCQEGAFESARARRLKRITSLEAAVNLLGREVRLKGVSESAKSPED